MFNFQWGERTRDGANNFITIRYDNHIYCKHVSHQGSPAIDSGRRVRRVGNEKRVAVSPIFRRVESVSSRCEVHTHFQQTHITAPAERSRGGICAEISACPRGGGGFESFSRRRLCPPLCNARFGKPAKTAWRYMHLAQVVPPDSSRYPMVPGATEAQYKATKESPLRKHNRSWTAVGNQVREQGLTLST